MSKYYLVASFYDGKDFLDECYIPNILGVELRSLLDIDKFTSSHSKLDILVSLCNDLNLQNKNQLSIKRYKNKNSVPDYFPVIFNNPEYYATISKSKKISYQLPDGRFIDSFLVDQRSKLYLSELSLLKDYLEKRDIATLEKLSGRKSDLFHLIWRYLSTDYDNYDAKKLDYRRIIDVFSLHKTFRYWIIQREKLQRKDNYFEAPRAIGKPNDKTKKKTIKPKGIAFYENDFSSQFMEKNKVSYEEYLTSLNNLSRLSEEKEEFLDSDEYEEMYLENHKRRGR